MSLIAVYPGTFDPITNGHTDLVNRGVEIDTKLADDINVSLVKEQVELGVAVRMAFLKIYCK